MDASVIVTYRCPMHCRMCNIWANPTAVQEEFKPGLLQKLPRLDFVNVTGGEPFVREDIEDIVRILYTKTRRIVFSTSGYYPERIIRLAERYPRLGFRISMEGLSCKNDELRGRPGGFDRGLRTLLELRRMGVKDIGFGITVSDSNSADMLWLYELSRNLKMEFATAALHNSYYFHKHDNKITNRAEVCGDFAELIQRMLREGRPKSWFRAFFNLGLVNYVRGGRRLLPCEAGTENFFIDPYGNVLPCNGMEAECWYDTMGDLHDYEDFMELWNGEKAKAVRAKVSCCPKKCWMVGSVSPVMKKYIWKIAPWVVRNKCRVMFGERADTTDIPFYHVGDNDRQGLGR